MSQYDGSKTARILEAARANPQMRNKEIARKLDVSHALVSKVRSDYGCKRPPDPESIFVSVDFMHQPVTHGWLVRTCPKGVTIEDHIVSILTDAMLEDQDG